MSSVVEICNLALSLLGVARVQALTETSKAAQECALLFSPTRDAVLSDFPWNFATKREVLSVTPGEYTGWTFAYGYPNECLRVREIINPMSKAAADRIKYEVALNATGSRRIILTNQEKAELLYTFRVTDPNLYDSTFCKALAYALAAELAMPMKGSPQMKDFLRKEYMSVLNAAQSVNANEVEDTIEERSAYERARD